MGDVEGTVKQPLTRAEKFLRDFSTHEIKEATEGSWLLQKGHPDGGWEGSLWMEVVSLHGAKLLVHGDFNPIVFAYSNRNTTPVGKVHWMGKRNYNNEPCSYFVEKATIGSGRESILEWNDRLARRELKEKAGEVFAEGYAKLADGYRNLALDPSWETEHEMMRELLSFDHDAWEESFGRQVRNSVLAAWATLARLSEILGGSK